jgi:ubiquinone/menaquinone biosynthesis C-methylase UbiE
MASPSVLDVGCGTGALLREARESGHAGRLCGLDPAEGMLAQARKRSDIEWVLGEMTPGRWRQEFDLIVMTGHAFQALIDDSEIDAVFGAIHAALTGAGRFVFDTSNPSFTAWKNWTPQNAIEARDQTGAIVRMAHQVDLPVNGDTVSFTTTYTSTSWERPELSRSTLRFIDAESLEKRLTAAGFLTAQQFGGWDRSPLTESSPEIITVAARS